MVIIKHSNKSYNTKKVIEMKINKAIAVIFLIIFGLLTLTGCPLFNLFGNYDRTSINSELNNSEQRSDETPKTSQPDLDNSEVDVESLLKDGKYEGELDENGKFTGWGIWIYTDFETYYFEGFFENGVPNGSGTLTITNPDNVYTRILEATFIDGLAHGMVHFTGVIPNESNMVFEFEINMGIPTEYEIVNAQGYTLHTEPGIWGVPPWYKTW